MESLQDFDAADFHGCSGKECRPSWFDLDQSVTLQNNSNTD